MCPFLVAVSSLLQEVITIMVFLVITSLLSFIHLPLIYVYLKFSIIVLPVLFYFIYFYFLQLINYFWLCWVFVAVCGLSLVAASGGYSSLQCAGFSLRWLLLLWRKGSRHAGSVVVAHGHHSAGSVVVAHGLSCSAACGIFLDQGSNPCSLHGQADS